MKRSKRASVMKFAITGATIALLTSSAAFADNNWNNYHWARDTNSFTLQVVDSTSADWDFELNTALSEWSQSNVFDLDITSSDDSNRTRRQCKMVSGQMRVCNNSYGNNGWLGLATIGLDNNGHIDQGTAKVNDTYASYWEDPDEKRHVMCQEIGHVLGLDHTSEDGSSQKTCMDYSSDSQSISPNAHDYSELSSLYGHTDSYNSYDDGGDSGGDKPCNAPPGKGCNKFGAGQTIPMGMRIHKQGRSETWVASRPDGGLWIHHVYLVDQQ